MTTTCENCRFWLQTESDVKLDSGAGACRRYPPVPQGHVLSHEPERRPDIHWTNEWPYLNKDAWCGEHQRLSN